MRITKRWKPPKPDSRTVEFERQIERVWVVASNLHSGLDFIRREIERLENYKRVLYDAHESIKRLTKRERGKQKKKK